MGFVHPVHEGMIKALGLALDPRGNVKADTDRLPDLAAEGVRRRRHAPRPVAGGLGDPRRPPMRARDRQVPDGNDHAAAVMRAARRGRPITGRTGRTSLGAARCGAAAAAAARARRSSGADCGRGDGAAIPRSGPERSSRRRRLHDRERIGGGGDRRIGAEGRDLAPRPGEIVAAPGRRRSAPRPSPARGSRSPGWPVRGRSAAAEQILLSGRGARSAAAPDRTSGRGVGCARARSGRLRRAARSWAARPSSRRASSRGGFRARR